MNQSIHMEDLESQSVDTMFVILSDVNLDRPAVSIGPNT